MEKLRYWVLIHLIILMICLTLACGGDDGIEPQNEAPVITSISASADTLDPSGTAEIVCVADDPDGDSLIYHWESADGQFEFDPSPSTVSWTAPWIPGRYTVELTVEDGRGGTASDSVLIQVRGGALVLQTRDGLVAVDLDGNTFLLSDETSRQHTQVEVLGTRIFVLLGSGIKEFNVSGDLVATIPLPPEVEVRAGFTVLPDGGFAIYDNLSEEITFIDQSGAFVHELSMPDTNRSLQHTSGDVINNTLIVSETEDHKMLRIDLSSYEVSILKDFGKGHRSLSDIDYDQPYYYLALDDEVLRFTDDLTVTTLKDIGEFNITGLTVVGRSVFVCVNFAGSIYRIDKVTKDMALFAEGINYPLDIEYVPATIQSP